MKYVVLTAVVGVIVLELSGSIPQGSVGGSMVIGFAFLAGAFALGIAEAVENRRGVLGWIVSIVVALIGAFIAAPLGGMIVAPMLSAFVDTGTSLAKSGSSVMSLALVGGLLIALAGSWGALKLVSRWR